MKDQHGNILFFVALAGLMIFKTIFFPCNCQVEPPQASAVVDTAAQKDLVPKGTVTMIDLGANSCIPCKMMAPIMENLKKTYEGKAAIRFVDVYQNKAQAQVFGIRAIPTQIFFDKNGREVYRHEGFLGEAAIVEQLKKMGVGQVPATVSEGPPMNPSERS